MNPLLPLKYFVPDVEARKFSDGRLYLYGSMDISGDGFYCSDRYHVFSSDNLLDWTDHGKSFDLAACHSEAAERLFAPDCIEIDGKYYLYYCGDDNCEGVAVSENPQGPFGDAKAVAGADGDAIDPAVFVDDDGEVYYYWGQFNLRGARMNPDFASLDGATVNTNLLNEAEHGFHEGPSIRKHNGIYYMVYTDISRGRATCLAYATSRSPLGPFVKGGIIIDNTGCDSQSWNNHGSITEFNGRWYVFYHRSSQGALYNRRVCAEPIEFNADGSIDEVEMITGGITGDLDASQMLLACRACRLSGELRTEPLHRFAVNDDYSESLSHIQNGDWAEYRYLDFTKPVTFFTATVGSVAGGGSIEVHLDNPDGAMLCKCEISATGGWKIWHRVEARLAESVTGRRVVYLVFKGSKGRLCDLLDFSFA